LGFAAALLAWRPVGQFLAWQERLFERVLRERLLLEIRPRQATWMMLSATAVLSLAGWTLLGGALGAALGAGVGCVAPMAVLRGLARRRLRRLDAQLVSGIRTLAAGVRAGLNLVQSMEMIAREGPRPLCEEFRHLLKEYEYGLPLDEAMDHAAERIGSEDYRLVFTALKTHRLRGGDLGETLDRIAESIREIQRLEARVQNLTATGRAQARWLGASPLLVLALLYLLVAPGDVRRMFIDPAGKLILLAIVVLNVAGFLWMRRIVDIDI
jgi:tight adherence protein B